jgi:hypothetical protein
VLQEALHYSAFVLIIEGMATREIICFWTTGPVVLLGAGLGSAVKLLKPVAPAVLRLVSSTRICSVAEDVGTSIRQRRHISCPCNVVICCMLVYMYYMKHCKIEQQLPELENLRRNQPTPYLMN